MTFISKQRAILFADVTDSTALYELLGDKPAAQAIEACLAALAQAVVQWQGTVVKTIGDEIMAAFPSADAACEAAKAMQGKVDALPLNGGLSLAVKIGFHYGQVLEDKNDFWGDGVNTAARLAGLARRGQILTSGASIDALSPTLRSATRDLDALNVKGKQDAVRVFEVVWQDDLESTQIVRPVRSLPADTRLRLSHAGTSMEFPSDKAAIWLGRDKGCELVIREKTASRKHARIERRGAQFFLVDDSTNGTYVAIASDRELIIRRESVLLRESGSVSLGVPGSGADDAITFDCF
jgi:class 3 adenylate cyclase